MSDEDLNNSQKPENIDLDDYPDVDSPAELDDVNSGNIIKQNHANEEIDDFDHHAENLDHVISEFERLSQDTPEQPIKTTSPNIMMKVPSYIQPTGQAITAQAEQKQIVAPVNAPVVKKPLNQPDITELIRPPKDILPNDEEIVIPEFTYNPDIYKEYQEEEEDITFEHNPHLQPQNTENTGENENKVDSLHQQFDAMIQTAQAPQNPQTANVIESDPAFDDPQPYVEPELQQNEPVNQTPPQHVEPELQPEFDDLPPDEFQPQYDIPAVQEPASAYPNKPDQEPELDVFNYVNNAANPGLNPEPEPEPAQMQQQMPEDQFAGEYNDQYADDGYDEPMAEQQPQPEPEPEPEPVEQIPQPLPTGQGGNPILPRELPLHPNYVCLQNHDGAILYCRLNEAVEEDISKGYWIPPENQMLNKTIELMRKNNALRGSRGNDNVKIINNLLQKKFYYPRTDIDLKKLKALNIYTSRIDQVKRQTIAKEGNRTMHIHMLYKVIAFFMIIFVAVGVGLVQKSHNEVENLAQVKQSIKDDHYKDLSNNSVLGKLTGNDALKIIYTFNFGINTGRYACTSRQQLRDINSGNDLNQVMPMDKVKTLGLFGNGACAFVSDINSYFRFLTNADQGEPLRQIEFIRTDGYNNILFKKEMWMNVTGMLSANLIRSTDQKIYKELYKLDKIEDTPSLAVKEVITPTHEPAPVKHAPMTKHEKTEADKAHERQMASQPNADIDL